RWRAPVWRARLPGSSRRPSAGPGMQGRRDRPGQVVSRRAPCESPMLCVPCTVATRPRLERLAGQRSRLSTGGVIRTRERTRRTLGRMVQYVAPPGWPRQVRPPDAPGWEHTAAAWLLDLSPPDYRGYPVLRRHLVVLARFAALHLEAGQA